ncbi:hypothetical protein MRX96_019244 [Rhipicephalus microplus]
MGRFPSWKDTERADGGKAERSYSLSRKLGTFQAAGNTVPPNNEARRRGGRRGASGAALINAGQHRIPLGLASPIYLSAALRDEALRSADSGAPLRL